MWVGPHPDDESGSMGIYCERLSLYASGETNYKVDITGMSDKKIRARSWFVSQFGAGNFKYVGPEPDQASVNSSLKSNAERIAKGEKNL